MKKYMAFFSPEMAQYVGYVYWKQKNGNEVKASLVTTDITGISDWDDIQFVGYVEEFSRRVSWGMLGNWEIE